MVYIIAHGVSALSVSLALAPGFGATHAARFGQARLNGPFGLPAAGVRGAAAVLQRRAVFGQVQLNQRGDAVTGTFPPLTRQDGFACVQILIVRVMTFGLGMALSYCLPTDQPTAVIGRGDGKITKTHKHASERPNQRASVPNQTCTIGHVECCKSLAGVRSVLNIHISYFHCI